MGIDSVAVNGVCVVRLPVYVDITNAADVCGAFNEGLEDGNTVVVADLAATESLSLEGLHVLIRVLAAAARRGAEFRLAAAQRRVRRFLDVTGTSGLFSLYDSLSEARIAHDGSQARRSTSD